MPPFVYVQMKINGGGLKAVMAQMVLDVGDGIAAVEHVHCLAVAKAMNRIDMLEALGRKDFFQIRFADAVNAMPGEFLSPLIDKQAILIQGARGVPVFSDIELKQVAGLCFQLYEPEPVSFSQDSQGFFLGIEVIQIERGDFTGPGAGIIEEMEERVIPEPLFSFEINRLKNLEHLILIKKPDQRLLRTLLRNGSDDMGHLFVFRIHKPDHFGKGFEGRQPVIACFDEVVSFVLQILKERDDEFP
jgi:hypothetical protein